MPITGKVNNPTLVSLRVVIVNDTAFLYTFGSASRNTDVLCTQTKFYSRLIATKYKFVSIRSLEGLTAFI